MPTSNINVVSRHWLNFRTGDKLGNRDLHFLAFSGVAMPNFIGTRKVYKQSLLKIQVDLRRALNNIPIQHKPDLKTYHPIFYVKEWKAYAGLNSVYNESYSYNTGFQVNSFAEIEVEKIKLNAAGNPIIPPDQPLIRPNEPLLLVCETGVRDVDAHLYRVAYQLDMLVCFAGFATGA